MGPPGSAASTTAVTGPPPTVPGAHQDPADFFGVFAAVAIIIGAIVVIRLAFRTRRPPPPSPARPDRDRPAEPPPPFPSSSPGERT